MNYQQVTHGVGGSWQISWRNRVSIAERVEFDAQHVQDWSGWLNIYILIQNGLVRSLRRWGRLGELLARSLHLLSD